ncbi:hypothetical protein E2C01_003518 [Portunus trituberculatus]|uniref:Uncharacterized protein n=1 Tax=Portunus trituberculatus TaxID=210409 RepID=A0A5B7CQC3_PORTR|nr:hypothetical protein [Portunus trituberculatus]
MIFITQSNVAPDPLTVALKILWSDTFLDGQKTKEKAQYKNISYIAWVVGVKQPRPVAPCRERTV